MSCCKQGWDESLIDQPKSLGGHHGTRFNPTHNLPSTHQTPNTGSMRKKRNKADCKEAGIILFRVLLYRVIGVTFRKGNFR